MIDKKIFLDLTLNCFLVYMFETLFLSYFILFCKVLNYLLHFDFIHFVRHPNRREKKSNFISQVRKVE